jgi:hypothetical protein
MHLLALFLQSQPDPEQVQKVMLAMMAIIPIVIIVGLAMVLVPFWFICKKAGFTPWLTLLNILPFGSIILWYVLAFAEWKVVPAPQLGWQQPTYPPQPPYPPQA